VVDDTFYILFNAHHEPIDFALPADEFGTAWVPVIYTATETDDATERHDAGGKVTVAARSVMVLRAATD